MEHSKGTSPEEATPADQAQPVPLTQRPILGRVQEDRYIHLVRLAWDLRGLGLVTRLELPPTEEPCVIVQRAAGPLRVTARTRGKSWIYQWGRGRNQWINALDEWASWTIHKAAAR